MNWAQGHTIVVVDKTWSCDYFIGAKEALISQLTITAIEESRL